jgi:tetratricopeptide (TPR) repeat protein
LSINIFSTSTSGGQSTTGLNGQFVFSQVLIDCLLRLKYNQTDNNELINCCQNEYEGNHVELSNLREFQKEYSPNKALWWYSRESFFYKTLNAALRTQNIHMIFLFRSLIVDVHQQLKKYQAKHYLQVYRSQMISNDELKTLQNSVGQFISINSFFSTSIDKKKALSFLDISDGSDNLQKMLFEIDADPKVVTTKPFADISKHSEYSNESEVLFMLGSIFRLENIKRNDDQIWIIRLSLCSDEEHALKKVLMDMEQQTGSGETNLLILGNILWDMGKSELAEKYFNRLLKELSSNDPLHIKLYEDLGKLASQRGDYDKSVEWRHKLVIFKEQHQFNVKSSINQKNNSTRKLIERKSSILKIRLYIQIRFLLSK